MLERGIGELDGRFLHSQGPRLEVLACAGASVDSLLKAKKALLQAPLELHREERAQRECSEILSSWLRDTRNMVVWNTRSQAKSISA